MSFYDPSRPSSDDSAPQQSAPYVWSTGSQPASPPPPPPGVIGYPQVAQPGAIPLRPLVLSDYFSGLFATIRNSPGTFFGAALLVGAIAAALSALGLFFLGQTGVVLFDGMESVLQNEGAPEFTGSLVSSFASTVGLFVLAQLVLLMGQILNWSLFSPMVARAAIGLKTPMGQAFRLIRAQWGRIIGLGLLLLVLAVLVYVVTLGMLYLYIVLLMNFTTEVNAGTFVMGLLGVILVAFTPVLIAACLTVRFLLVVPAMIVEDIGIFAAARRSWGLTRRRFWRTLGISLLFGLILGIVSQIIVTPLSFLFGIVSMGAGTEAELMGTMTVLYMVVISVTGLVTFVVGNMALLISIFFYFDYRFRAEGLGFAFQHMARQHSAGVDRFDTSAQSVDFAKSLDNDVIPGRAQHMPPPDVVSSGFNDDRV